ncbi:hypothetical protein RHGRI_034676 [Rhododendron griersonianum]|uniref:Cleavage stimulating factor 64 n=1 Tax=Rhododendron griersonianum TaxID=479676 RepID=A0AAV6I7K5_9ERIC|nr:hypothetical protein RHGRI_034676 [Rhododendron griersonianum]
MAAKQVDGDGISANLAGMSKNQLYEIMCQMKASQTSQYHTAPMLIEQNQQQARQILIQNPLLTKALFQAQIMLGMVQPPQAIPIVQPTVALPRTQPAQPVQQANIQATQALPGQNGSKDQTSSAPQISSLTRNQHQNPPAIPVPPASSASPFNLPTQSFPPHALQPVVQQPEGQHISNQATTMSLPQSSQLPNISPLPHQSASHTPPLQPPMSIGSTQLQQSLQKSVIQHLPLQPPLPPQPRLPSMAGFSHQLHSQIGQNAGFQHHSGAPQMHHSQNMFHLGNNPPSGMRPSFQQGQPPLPSQPPPQSLYQVGGSHLGRDFNSQVGSSMQPERGPVWLPGLSDNMGTQLPGPPPSVPGQMGQGSQPPRPAPLTPEVEQALLQQVMNLSQEQINNLPPDQRTQILQLQQMIRR